ncbi:MAG: ERAP1-like C-terminal domain-containing protein, partial [Cyanobacteria bacterium]|nr:ERAP1-like C-terminal domain-containing protein [Cyanobacteriota bacterium]
RHVLPNVYKIFIEPDLKAKTFKGEESINLTISRPCKEIALNSLELELSNPEIIQEQKAGQDSWLKGSINADHANQLVSIRFSKQLEPGNYELKLSFKGKLNDKLVGFYSSTTKLADGKEVTLASTQMEPTDARRMFPCFDEPDMKARFRMTVAVAPDMVAISNGAVKSEKVDEKLNKRLFTFEDTPVMSTYLVALIVGPFEATEVKEVNGVKIRVWATRGKGVQGAFSLGVAAKILPFFENYFGVKYPLGKLDLIAIPDFGAGAMENLGAITFRENKLLVEESTASIISKEGVVSIIAHEMAHMWFGDVVTMKWWDDLWLNEAFATWMSVKAMEYYNPDWLPWERFLQGRSHALATDCLNSTRPIYAKVSDPADAEEMFDEITYDKGAGVLRMLERYLGEEPYMKGIQDYIKSHEFNNATTADLWHSLEKLSGKPVSAIMHNWIFEPGYPQVVVDSTDEKSIVLSQRRFNVTEGDKAQKGVWHIPVGLKYSKDSKTTVSTILLDKETGTFPWTSDSHLVLMNADADGYFRARYPADVLLSISKTAEEKLNAKERYQLVGDAWAMVELGALSIGDYMRLTSGFKDEKDPNVIEGLINGFSSINLFIDDASRSQFAAFVRDRLAPMAELLGWQAKPGEPDMTKILRGDVLAAMGTIGEDPATIAEARKLFKDYAASPEKVDPNLYDAIVGIVAYNGGDEDYAAIKKCWQGATSPESKVRNLMALGDFRRPELQSKTLDMALTDDVRTQDAPHLVIRLTKQPAGREIGWAFMKSHWQDMVKRYPPHVFPRLLTSAYAFVSSTQAQELEKFLGTHKVPNGRRVSAKVLERVKLNVKIAERSSKPLASWLKDFQKTAEEQSAR